MSDQLKRLHLHFDCVSGAAGDMTLGALFDLGVPTEVVTRVVDALGLGRERVRVERVVKAGISAVDVKVKLEDIQPGEDAHEHRHYGEIKRLICNAALSPGVVERATDIFDRVARAESSIHGRPIEDVAFHEVGAIDSIVDIVGTAAALDWLSPRSVSCAGVAMGHGSVQCAHGVLPVPAPAALAIMVECGGRMLQDGPPRELCTPTGAAILAHAVTHWGPMPDMQPAAIGYGAGDHDLPDRANVMRAVAGRPAVADGEVVYRVEANVDDMNPELCDNAARALFDAGAVDVWWGTIVMKSGRPALQLSALTAEATLDAVIAAALRETTTLGVRFDLVARRTLTREWVSVETEYGRARVKVARSADEVVNVAPEYRDCAELARQTGIPLKRVFAAVSAAYHHSK